MSSRFAPAVSLLPNPPRPPDTYQTTPLPTSGNAAVDPSAGASTDGANSADRSSSSSSSPRKMKGRARQDRPAEEDVRFNVGPRTPRAMLARRVLRRVHPERVIDPYTMDIPDYPDYPPPSFEEAMSSASDTPSHTAIVTQEVEASIFNGDVQGPVQRTSAAFDSDLGSNSAHEFSALPRTRGDVTQQDLNDNNDNESQGGSPSPLRGRTRARGILDDDPDEEDDHVQSAAATKRRRGSSSSLRTLLTSFQFTLHDRGTESTHPTTDPASSSSSSSPSRGTSFFRRIKSLPLINVGDSITTGQIDNREVIPPPQIRPQARKQQTIHPLSRKPLAPCVESASRRSPQIVPPMRRTPTVPPRRSPQPCEQAQLLVDANNEPPDQLRQNAGPIRPLLAQRSRVFNNSPLANATYYAGQEESLTSPVEMIADDLGLISTLEAPLFPVSVEGEKVPLTAGDENAGYHGHIAEIMWLDFTCSIDSYATAPDTMLGIGGSASGAEELTNKHYPGRPLASVPGPAGLYVPLLESEKNDETNSSEAPLIDLEDNIFTPHGAGSKIIVANNLNNGPPAAVVRRRQNVGLKQPLVIQRSKLFNNRALEDGAYPAGQESHTPPVATVADDTTLASMLDAQLLSVSIQGERKAPLAAGEENAGYCGYIAEIMGLDFTRFD